jgi:hypothetical protein
MVFNSNILLVQKFYNKKDIYIYIYIYIIKKEKEKKRCAPVIQKNLKHEIKSNPH